MWVCVRLPTIGGFCGQSRLTVTGEEWAGSDETRIFLIFPLVDFFSGRLVKRNEKSKKKKRERCDVMGV